MTESFIVVVEFDAASIEAVEAALRLIDEQFKGELSGKIVDVIT